MLDSFNSWSVQPWTEAARVIYLPIAALVMLNSATTLSVTVTAPCCAACLNFHVSRVGLDDMKCPAFITEHLEAGALVLPEEFMQELAQLPTDQDDLREVLENPGAWLNAILADADYCTGDT
jgi:hypothetical protein